jgi:hypothetical protein
VNKKIVFIITTVFLLSLLAGCINWSGHQDDKKDQSQNLLPVPIIKGPEEAFFGDPIEFTATGSYDPDGTIESYFWSFGDNKTADTPTVTHTYVFDNNFDIEYPLIYSVILNVKDNNGSYETALHLIMLYPKEYRFYLNQGKLSVEKPSSNKDTLKASFGKILSLQEILYELDDPVFIKECRWNATIYIQKPRLAFVRSISLSLYDQNNSKISQKDVSFGLFDLWKEKTVLVNGEINKSERFKSAKLVVYGFTLGKKINVLYGGDTASSICFDFT